MGQRYYNKKNYRPISLTDIDAKSLRDITKSNSVLCRMIIHNEQIEYIPGMQDWFNI